MAKTEAELRASRAYRERQKALDPEGYRQRERERMSAAYQADPEKFRQRRVRNYHKDVEHSREVSRAWHHANKDASLGRARRWKDKVAATPEYKEKVRNWNLRRLYGLTTEEWEKKFEAQGFTCEACGSAEPKSKRGWATDHNHKTGILRGIICLHCNVALGKVDDNIERLKMLISYLEKYSE